MGSVLVLLHDVTRCKNCMLVGLGACVLAVLCSKLALRCAKAKQADNKWSHA